MEMCAVTFSLNVGEHVMAATLQGRLFQSMATRGKYEAKNVVVRACGRAVSYGWPVR